MMAEMDAAVADAVAATGRTAGTLRINTLGMAAKKLISPRLGRFHKAYPDVVLDIVGLFDGERIFPTRNPRASYRILLCNWHWCRRRGWPLVVRCPNRYRLALEPVCGVPAGLAPDARSGTCRFPMGGRRRTQAVRVSGKAARLYRIKRFASPRRSRMSVAALAPLQCNSAPICPC